MTVSPEIKEYINEQLTSKQILQQNAFRDETQWMREEIKDLKIILAALAIHYPNNEIKIAQRNIDYFKNGGFYLEFADDKINRTYNIKLIEK